MVSVVPDTHSHPLRGSCRSRAVARRASHSFARIGSPSLPSTRRPRRLGGRRFPRERDHRVGKHTTPSVRVEITPGSRGCRRDVRRLLETQAQRTHALQRSPDRLRIDLHPSCHIGNRKAVWRRERLIDHQHSPELAFGSIHRGAQLSRVVTRAGKAVTGRPVTLGRVVYFRRRRDGGVSR